MKRQHAVAELKHAVGIFPNRQAAESTLRGLRDAGFPLDTVPVITENPCHHAPLPGADASDSTGNQIKGGARAGAIAGTTAGRQRVSLTSITNNFGEVEWLC